MERHTNILVTGLCDYNLTVLEEWFMLGTLPLAQ